MGLFDGPRQALDLLGSGDLGLAPQVTGVGRMSHVGLFGNRADGDLLVPGDQRSTGCTDLCIGDIELVFEGGEPWSSPVGKANCLLRHDADDVQGPADILGHDLPRLLGAGSKWPGSVPDVRCCWLRVRDSSSRRSGA
jgi:hypothetical protein